MQGEGVAKGLIAGIAASVAASLAMDLFQRAHAATGKRNHPAPSGPEEDEPATTKLANRAAFAVSGHRLPGAYAPYGGAAVHYGTGAAIGALYGALAEVQPVVTAGAGTGYGTAVWAAVDEGLVPALRLGPRPGNVGLSEHAYGLASHLVFGVTLEAVRRLVRRSL